MAMFNFRLTQSEPQVWKDVWKLLQIVICLQTNHQLVLKNSFKHVRSFQIEFEFESVDYRGDGKNGVPGENLSEQGGEPTTNSTHMTPMTGFEPGLHWWEASSLTTAPPLLPITKFLLGNQAY